MNYTALDLSPYYLYEARSNIKEWHRLRQPKLRMGGVDGSGTHFLQAAAEHIPQPDASHDVVSATFPPTSRNLSRPTLPEAFMWCGECNSILLRMVGNAELGASCNARECGPLSFSVCTV